MSAIKERKKSVFQRNVPVILASVGIIFGLSAFAGWILGIPFLASFGSAVPMAPSSALLFILFGLLIYFPTQLNSNSLLYRIRLFLALALLSASVILLYVSYHGIHLNAEHLGFHIYENVGSIPLGHISPFSALLFVLSGICLLITIIHFRGSNKGAIIAFILACIIIFSGIILVLAYVTGAPVLYGTVFIPPALSTSISFISLGIALMAYSNNYAWIAVFPLENSAKRIVKFLVGTFIILFIGITTTGYLYFKSYAHKYRNGINDQLSSIAGLKAEQIFQWKNERHADAVLLYNNIAFSELVDQILDKKTKNEHAVRNLTSWLTQLQSVYGYDKVLLTDTTGKVITPVTGGPVSLSPASVKKISALKQTKQILFNDLGRESDTGHIYLTILVPVLKSDGSDKLLAIIELWINPVEYLFPVINYWPVPNKTAENVLVRQEGNNIIVLSELRFLKGSALFYKKTLSESEWSAVHSILRQKDILEGLDYRNEAVIAHVIHIKGTPWYLISKIDKAEVFASLQNRLWGILILIGTLILSTIIIIVFIWRNHYNRTYREKYQTIMALHESTEKFIKAFQNKSVFMSIMKTDGTYVDVNDYSTGYLGYTPGEMIGRTNEYLGLFTIEGTMQQISESMSQTGYIHNREVLLNTRDGFLRYGNMSVETLGSGDEKLWLIIIVDITSFKLAEVRVLKLNRVYTVLSDINKSIVRIRDPKELYEKVCRIAVEKGKLALAWIGLFDEKTGNLFPAAFAGKYQDYLEQAIVSIQEAPCGHCPIADSIRTGGYHKCVMSAADTAARTCVKEAMEYGFRSVISFALKVKGDIRGTINFYSTESDFFNEEEIRLMEELAMDISFFMEFNEIEVKRQLAGAALFESEKKLHMLNIELEERVRDRTAELDSINKELESFAYTISHDLRAPLRVISGFTSFLRDDYSAQLDAEGMRLLSIIIESTRRMDQLINDILAVSKITRKEIINQKIDMNALAHDVFEEICGDEKKKKIHFTVDDIPSVHSDMVLMKQLWSNLISNSIKYTSKKDKPEIRITGKSEGNVNTYSIIDNGAGFDQNYVHKLFNLFQRLHSLEEFEGTGVGLTIVKRIVDRFGGDIHAEGSPGNGAIFCFTLSNMDGHTSPTDTNISSELNAVEQRN